ncbi:aquaporin-like protein [Cantharellus anzutake]|uniref:aquaporin-like protein n=1 Tax=Cantharellus anzutake TaxID=1750568 RepID=UPI001905B91A|nr:aquaporin-like protein [Cantharellus anzutake]KAF8336431.1 aquaporin-like protein [Cantharellus anzutake]
MTAAELQDPDSSPHLKIWLLVQTSWATPLLLQFRFAMSQSNDNHSVHKTQSPPIETVPYASAPYSQRTAGPVGAWAALRHQYLREAALEFIGTFMLVFFGSSGSLQAVVSSFPAVSSSPKGDIVTGVFGWAAGLSLGVWVASGSGGHINPAVTIAVATFRGFPWKKVPVYIGSQVLGGIVATLISWGNYMHAIHLADPGKTRLTASCFAIYAGDFLPSAACFFSEFLGTFLLVFVILAGLDKKNGALPTGLLPLILFILFIGMGSGLGINTAYGLNPARDFGPRIGLSILGYSRSVIWNYRSQFWIWSGIISPICGGVVAVALYDTFIYTGDDSILSPTALSDAEIPLTRNHAETV